MDVINCVLAAAYVLDEAKSGLICRKVGGIYFLRYHSYGFNFYRSRR